MVLFVIEQCQMTTWNVQTQHVAFNNAKRIQWHYIFLEVFAWHVFYDLSLYVTFSGSNTIHSTRSTTDTAFLMVPPICRTEGFKRSFYNRIVPLWNSLPHSVRCIENVSTFKRVLKKKMFGALCTDFEIETFDSWFIKCVC
jgi:hypothetical protein